MRYVLLIVAAFMLIIPTAAIVESNNQTNAEYEWALMLYMNGDNTLYAYLQQRLQQIAAEGASDDIAIAILYDGRDYGDTKLYYIEGNTLLEKDWPAESDMSSGDTLSQFVTKIMNERQAEHYYLSITSNKGSGWQGVCWDDNGDGIMITMPELINALNVITDNGENKIDVLQIESCLCGNLELRYQLHTCCNYFVGYADCGVLGDIAYTDIIAELKHQSSMNPEYLTNCILENYSPPNDRFYKVFGSIGVTDSLVLDELISAIDELSLALLTEIDEYRADILLALNQTRIYGELWDINYYVDPVHFLELLNVDSPDIQTAKNNVIELVEAAVIEKKICEDSISCGLNIYIPRVKIDYNRPLRYDNCLPAEYEDTFFAQDTNWDEFIIALLELDENISPEAPDIEGPSRGEIGVEYSYSFSSIDAEGDNLYYYIDWGDGNSSGWIGPYNSEEDVTLMHIWTQQNNYNIKAKARDAINSESSWGTLEVSMPKNKKISLVSTAFLVGIVTDIEQNSDGDFRFLPIKVVELIYSPESGMSFSMLDELDGGFPCCGFIDVDQFKGILNDNFICGLWQIET